MFPPSARLGGEVGTKLPEELCGLLTPLSWLLSFYPTWAWGYAITCSCLITKPHLGRWVYAAPWCTLTTLTCPWMMENWLTLFWTMVFGYLYPAFPVPLSFPQLNENSLHKITQELCTVYNWLCTHICVRVSHPFIGECFTTLNTSMCICVYVYMYLHTYTFNHG